MKDNALFEETIERKISGIIKIRKRSLPGAGKKWKRHPVDELAEKHNITGTWLRQEFEAILEKKSKLPASQRRFLFIMGLETIKQNVQAQPQPQNPNPCNPPKST